MTKFINKYFLHIRDNTKNSFCTNKKKVFIYFMIIFLISCRNSNKTKLEEPYFKGQNYNEYNFVLQDSITKITIKTPTYLDTSFCWIHRTCGIPNQKNRIQSKKQPVFLENGFYWDEVNDKTEITFEQQYLGYNTPRLSYEEVREKQIMNKEENSKDPLTQKLVLDTILKVDSMYFLLLGYILEQKEKVKRKQIIRTNFYAGKTYVRVELINTDTSITIQSLERDCIEIFKSIKINEEM